MIFRSRLPPLRGGGVARHRTSLVAAIAACALLAPAAQAQAPGDLLSNGDFEGTSLADQSAWRPIPHGAIDAGTDAAAPAHEGRTSFRIARDAASSDSFVGVGQAIDAVPLRGKTVRFRAAARVAERRGGASGGLWLRVDREGGGRGFFDNMSDRPILSEEWAVYEIEGRVSEDATRLTAGFLLNGVGAGWIDAASLEVVEETPVAPAAAPLTTDQIGNLAAFAKIYGYVRWFSPYSEPNHARWDVIAAEGAEAALSADGPEALAAILQPLFEPWAPGLLIGRRGVEDAVPPAGGTDLVRWRHVGVEFVSPAYNSERVGAGRLDVWRAEPGQGLSVAMALTAPRASLSAQARPAGVAVRQPPEHRGTRLAATVIAWNVFRHFYPYFEDDGAAWDAGLEDWLAGAATAPDAESFGNLLRRMVAKLDDGHGTILPTTEGFLMPLLWRWVDGALVVTATAGPATDVAVGDVVVAIDGRRTETLLADTEELVSASTAAHRRWRAADALRLRSQSRPVSLRLRGAEDVEREVVVTPLGPGALEGRLQESRPAAVTWLPQGPWYFDLTRLNDRRLREALGYVRPDQPVIFDLRGYPDGAKPDFLGHLSDQPVVTPPFLLPVTQRPEAQGREWKQEGWEVRPVFPRFKGQIAFLTDERAMSYSETLLAMVRGRQLAEIVGSPTAGANGNINPFRLPGGYEIRWTGMKVINHDGSDLAGHGVQPTIAVAPTVEGLRQGRDEVLERAIEFVTLPPESQVSP